MKALRKTGILALALAIAVIGITGCLNPGTPGQPPVSESFTVEVTAGERGTMSANPASGKVTQGTVIMFTALPVGTYTVYHLQQRTTGGKGIV
ncbi:hypothetical protein [Treponema pectinovorum]|uniref:hypothetical protein n=1 Tax=Treponema pectinovorum TaxID=164 RepID=UPI0011CA722D|nr:hypothetical protein [Treponema pectinovorum]